MEVRGLTEDHPGCEVILSEADLDTMVPRPRLGTGRDRVHHVQTAADLQEGWFDEAGTVGITAVTSTPDSIIDEIEEALERIAAGACRHELAAA